MVSVATRWLGNASWPALVLVAAVTLTVFGARLLDSAAVLSSSRDGAPTVELAVPGNAVGDLDAAGSTSATAVVWYVLHPLVDERLRVRHDVQSELRLDLFDRNSSHVGDVLSDGLGIEAQVRGGQSYYLRVESVLGWSGGFWLYATTGPQPTTTASTRTTG